MDSLITFLGWSALAVISTVDFSFVPVFFHTERRRLAEHGNKQARAETDRLAMVPLLQSLQVVVRTLGASGLITFCVFAYGVVPGVLVGTFIVLLLPLAARLRPVRSLADKLQQVSQPGLEKLVTTIAPVLRVLRPRDRGVAEQRLHSHEELLALVKKSKGVLTTSEQKRLEAGLAFGSAKVSDVMTPLDMVKAIESTETLGPLVLDELYKTKHNFFPVFARDLDHVVGILRLSDLIDMRSKSQDAASAMHKKVYYVRETDSLERALAGFIKDQHHLFVVVDSVGKTVGVLGLTDVIKALTGEAVSDEFEAFDDLHAVLNRK